jgi:hypothetical protein
VHKIAVSGLVAVAAVLGGVAPASAAMRSIPAAPPRQQSSITLTAYTAVGRISCGSPKSCLAVGENLSRPDHPTPVAEAWNGTAWRSIPVPIPKTVTNVFAGDVSCPSATSCLVVGTYEPLAEAGGPDQPYAMTWNGTSLTPTPVPPAPKGRPIVSLSGVSCFSARSCVAVGFSLDPGAPIAVETWNGAKWTLRTAGIGRDVPIAIPNAVSCLSVTSCVVAGEAFPVAGVERMFLARWNGSRLTAMKATPPAGAKTVTMLNDVSCASPNSCVAAGMSTNSAGTSGFGFAEVWNGVSWTAHKVAVPSGDAESALFGVSCVAGGHCVAVGSVSRAKASRATALSYNGRTWSAQNVPGPGKGRSSDFGGVSCQKAAECVAIGEIGASGKTTTTPLAGLWNGSSWKLVAA